MQVCRICLSTDRKMYPLDSKSIRLYVQITGLPFVVDDPLPKLVCWECVYYLSKYFHFKNRAITSYCILTEIWCKYGVITKSSLETRNWNPYKSSLTQSEIWVENIEGHSSASDIKIESEFNIELTDARPSTNTEGENSEYESNENKLFMKEDEEIKKDLLASDIKIERECDDDTIFFGTENDKIDTELTDHTLGEDSAKKESKENNLFVENEEIEEESLVSESDIKMECECEDTIVSATENVKFVTKLTDDKRVLASTNPLGENSANKESKDNKFKEDEEIKDPLVSYIKMECECDNTIVFGAKKDEFDTELSDDKNMPASTNTGEEEKEGKEKMEKNEERKKRRRKDRKAGKNAKPVFEKVDKDFISVTELTMDEQLAEIEMKKKTENYKKSPFKCEECYRGFIDSVAYKRHVGGHSESRGPHACPVCKLRFNTPRLQKAHTAAVHSHKFSCLKCKFTTKHRIAAVQHTNYHKGKTYECPAPHCSAVFGYKTTFLSHLRTKHPSDVVCKHCGFTFLNEQGLRKHIVWNHPDQPKQVPADGPACARCDIRFSCRGALDTHRRVSAQHADERTAGIVKPGRNTRQIYRKEDKSKRST